MDFKLEISRDNSANSYKTVDLFPQQQLEYDLDFYDSVDIDKVKLPFYTKLKVPITDNNKASNRFDFDPYTSLAADFPRDSFYFKVSVSANPVVEISGMLDVISFEYNSSEPYIELELKDYLSKYITEFKNKGTGLGSVYTDSYYSDRQTMANFLSTEEGTIGVNPDPTEAISFPYVDFCNDVDGKFGYAARHFLEYGPGMIRGGFTPAFSVPRFLSLIADFISDDVNFPLRADSKLFEIGAYAGSTGIVDFQPEKLHLVAPARILAKQDINTREFTVYQAPSWSGDNESLEYCEDLEQNPKLIHTSYFGDTETAGNYGTDAEGQPTYSIATWGSEKKMDFYPSVDSSGFDNDGIRGFFVPKVSFNAAISSPSAQVNLNRLKFEIPVIGEDKLVADIDLSSPNSTMTWKVYVGIYRDGLIVKEIPLLDSVGGNDIVLSIEDIAAKLQGPSNKGDAYPLPDFFYCGIPRDDIGALIGNNATWSDTLEFDQTVAYFPSGEELFVDSGSQYSVNYFARPFDGELEVVYIDGYVIQQFNTNPGPGPGGIQFPRYVESSRTQGTFKTSDIRKAITSLESFSELNIRFIANADFLPYKTTDEISIQDSINDSCSLTAYEIFTGILKRFDCGMFYEYDSVAAKHVLRIDPLSLIRSGSQDVNQYVDDLKSVKITNSGDKVKSLEITNQDYGLYFDDFNNDDITIGSTLQDINTNGIAELKIDLKSSIYYKSVCGEELDVDSFSNVGAFSENHLGVTSNLFTQYKDIGFRFAYIDKPLYKTNLLTQHAVLEGFRTDDKMKTESQIIQVNQTLSINNTINGQYIFNGRLFNYNTAGWNLMFEDEDANVTQSYTEIFEVSEKILQSESPLIEFDMVVPVSNLSDLNFFLQSLTATRFTSNNILIKSVNGDVYDDYAYLTIEGLLQ